MSTEIERLLAVLDGDASGLINELKKANNAVKNSEGVVKSSFKTIRKQVNDVGNAFFSLKTAIAGLGAGLVAKGFLNTAVSMEQMQIQLKTLLGTTKEADQLFNKLVDVASELPFELDNINNAAIRLSSAFGKNQDEIVGMTRAAANVAAIFGEKVGGIEGAADQIARAFAAGTGAADRFRDAGVTAMLGIKNGASLSGEEFQKKFLEVFGAGSGKFKDAAFDMASTWTGVVSMIADKYTKLQKSIMDAGVFEYVKAIAKLFDNWLGNMTKDTEENKRKWKEWSDAIINSIEFVIEGLGYLKRTFTGFQVIWKALELSWAGVKLLIITGIDELTKALSGTMETILRTINDVINKARELVGKEPIEFNFEAATDTISDMKDTALADVEEIKQAMHDIVMDDDSLEQSRKVIKDIRREVEAAAARKKELESKETVVADPGKSPFKDAELTTEEKGQLKKIEALEQSLMTEEERIAESYRRRQELVNKAFEDGLVTHSKMNEIKEGLEEQHEKNMKAIRDKYERSALASAKSLGSSLMALSQGQSKRMFKVAKTVAIATAVVDTYKAAQGAWADTPGPVWVRALAAGAALAAGLQNVRAIKATSYQGGGGGAGGAGGGSIPASGGGAPTTAAAPADITGGGGRVVGQQISINLDDDDNLYSGRTIRRILDGINEQIRDGATIEGIQVNNG